MRASTNPQAKAAHALIEQAHPGPRGLAKRAVLGAALSSFNRKGLEATGIEDLKQGSGLSVGTLYHHFKNKEGVVAELFFLAFDDQSRAIAQALELAQDARSQVHALVRAYLRWASAQPDMARLLLLARDAVAKGPHALALQQRLQARYEPIDERLSAAMRAGEIPSLPEDIVPALVLGPAESYCRGWLSGQRPQPPTRFEAEFAASAWQALSQAR